MLNSFSLNISFLLCHLGMDACAANCDSQCKNDSLLNYTLGSVKQEGLADKRKSFVHNR